MATNGYIAPKYSVFDIYQTVFGYRAIPYPKALIDTAKNGFQSYDNELKDRTQRFEEKLSLLGASLFKKDENGVEAFCPITLVQKKDGEIIKKFDLPYSTIAVTLSKNIVKTALPARRGTVKELIQVEDIQFQINGIIMGSSDEQSDDYALPQLKIMALDELFNINEPVYLENAFAEIFLQLDNAVVIESMDLPDMKGISGSQAYSIRLVSDIVLELEEK